MKLEALSRLLRPLTNKVQNMVGRCVLQAVRDEKNMQLVKISGYADEILEDVERFQDYGFTSNPLPGAEACAVFVGGRREHGIVIKVDDRRFRFKNMESGEVAMYTDEGDFIHFKRGNAMEISTGDLTINAADSVTVNTTNATVNATGQTDVNTPTCNISDNVNIGGNLAVTGFVQAQGDITTFVAVPGGTSISQLRSVYNSHGHNQGNDSDGDSQVKTNVPVEQVP